MFDSELIPQLSDREIEALTVAEAAARDDVASDGQMIPDRLDEWRPGPFLAAVLSSIDPSRLNGHDTVVLMKAHARQVAHDQSGYYSSVAEVATAVPAGEDGPPERTESGSSTPAWRCGPLSPSPDGRPTPSSISPTTSLSVSPPY
jgi:hypothetical protein